ncbi:phosphotransferase family protein [Actinoallomurus sp. CA-150999]|uniref:phosphotransferase family protein n=1 Tax=Actinoallomurus sp. CA-150999 TaxID=3239887 RepID=UPI003D8D95C3
MGAGSTTLHAIDAGIDPVRRLVVRRFHDVARLRTDPWYVPANEAAVLELLDDTEVPAPRLLAADPYGRICDVPALLVTRVPGRPAATPWDMDAYLAALAQALARVHEVPPEPGLRSYAPYHDPAVYGERRPPAWSGSPELWQRAFEVISGPAPETATGFIHRDFHPGQTLWTGDRLTGIVDWTTGCRGPYGVDLARMRINLAIEYGVEVAERFLAVYQATVGHDGRHPYWDLLDAADMILDMPVPETQAVADGYSRFEHWTAIALASVSDQLWDP